MKKNLTRKLALSAVTMGVAALTVTSTTYAWYTNNSSATASELKVETQAAEGNLLIQNGNDGTSKNEKNASIVLDKGFGTSLTLTEIGNKLTPAQWAKKIESNNDEADNESFVDVERKNDAVVDNHFIWFNVDVPAGKKATISMTLDHLEFSGRKQQTLTMLNKSGNNPTGDTSVTVGLQDVLGLKVTRFAKESEELNEAVTVTSANYRYLAEGNINEDVGDALVYYNNVMGKSETRPDTYSNFFSSTTLATESTKEDTTTTTANSITLFTVNNITTDVKTVQVGICFTFFIDGWDKDCYNVIGGQSITGGSLKFSMSADSNADKTE